MNVKKIREMADHLDPLPPLFDHRGDDAPDYARDAVFMGYWLRERREADPAECGTIGCLAGHIVVKEDGLEAARKATFTTDGGPHTSDRAAQILGLGQCSPYAGGRKAKIADALFHPRGVTDDCLIGGRECAKVLRLLADDPNGIDADDIRRAWQDIVRERWSD